MRESGGRRPCPTHLRQIGQAMHLYAHEHGGRFPDSLDLLVGDDIMPEALVCPSTDDRPASGETAQEIRAALVAGGDAHLSYVYVGAGLTADADSDVVVAYDRLGNHDEDGCHVLYADGHVNWMPMPTMRRVQAEVDAGRLPVRTHGGSPRSQPATAPHQ